MKKEFFWYLMLCVVMVISLTLGDSIPLRIAYGGIGVGLLLDVISDIRRIRRGE